MGFRDVFGHESAVRALQKALAANQLPGTYLFTGPQGIGKTTLALAFAEAAACLAPPTESLDSCGQCDSCRRARAGEHPEIALISPAGDQTQIWQFWDRDGRPAGILQHSLHFAPVIGRRRVYIIERADTLNEAAANSLLKALEEPPPYAVFVLLATHAGRLLPTVLSRSQLLRLLPAPIDELAQYLCARAGVAPERARAIAAYAEGRPGTALALARGKGVEAEINAILDLAEQIASATPLSALAHSERIRKQAATVKSLLNLDEAGTADASAETDSAPKERAGRRQLGILLDLVTAYYRDLLAASLGGPESAILHIDRAARIHEIAAQQPAGSWTRRLERLMLARRQIDQNANQRLVTDVLAIHLITT